MRLILSTRLGRGLCVRLLTRADRLELLLLLLHRLVYQIRADRVRVFAYLRVSMSCFGALLPVLPGLILVYLT